MVVFPRSIRLVCNALALALVACAYREQPGSPDAISRYGWSLHLPNDCTLVGEERAGDALVGRASWTCGDVLVELDATPFADPLLVEPGAVERGFTGFDAATDCPTGEPARRPLPARSRLATYVGGGYAFHHDAADRSVTVTVVSMRRAVPCASAWAIFASLAPSGPRLSAPARRLLAPSLVFDVPWDRCHRRTIFSDYPVEEELECGEVIVRWWSRGAPPGPHAPSPVRRSSQDDALTWEIELAGLHVAVVAPQTAAPQVELLLKSLRSP
ncbi:MAG: hypothetical protein IPK80_03270 [Nannocystis sp.]|nr:hypothetical protein [Nannocystis sp.]